MFTVLTETPPGVNDSSSHLSVNISSKNTTVVLLALRTTNRDLLRLLVLLLMGSFRRLPWCNISLFKIHWPSHLGFLRQDAMFYKYPQTLGAKAKVRIAKLNTFPLNAISLFLPICRYGANSLLSVAESADGRFSVEYTSGGA